MMNSKGYTNIPDWMLVFDLDVYETIILAVIFGFSQDGESTFAGSQNYLARKAKCKRNKVAKSLSKLVEHGLIEKIDKNVRGVHLCEYRVYLSDTGCISQRQGGCIQEIHKNIDDINIDKDTIKEVKFNFKSALVEIGVSEDVADAWMQVRKTKMATNTEIAFKAICNEISKSGKTPNECITIAVQNSWQGFKASWIEERRSTRTAPRMQQKESVLSHNLKVMDQMFGTDMHSQAYGKKEVYDEQ